MHSSFYVVFLSVFVTGCITDNDEHNKIGHVCPFIFSLTFEPVTFDLDYLHVYGS